MKIIWKKGVALCLTLLLCMTGLTEAFAADTSDEQSANHYNVVFVIDESGSMKHTDADKLRYDATDLFLGLMSQTGNYAGTVSFDDKIMYSQKLSSVSGSGDKETIASAIKKHSTTGGDTDIGGALEQAVSMLDKNANKSIPSVILLLTDGNTDLDNNPKKISDEEEESIQKKSDAVEQARKKGYSIYSICLNENGSADFSETKQIANATGGQAIEVKNAAGLEDAFEMFYKLIYGTGENPIYEGEVPVDAPFTVPSSGVEEANIMIQGNPSSITIKDPEGKKYTDAIETDCGEITLEKITDPQAGKWIVSVDGDPGTKVKINLIYNYNFTVKDTTSLKDSYHKGNTVKFTATLTDSDGKPLKDPKDYSAEVRFLDEKNQVTETVPLKLSGDSFSGSYKIRKSGYTYRYYIAVRSNTDSSDENIYKKSAVRQFESGSNAAPVSNGDVKETIKLWPFKDNTYTLDVTTLAKDPEGADLSYSILSSSFIDKAEDSENGDYTFDGKTLTQDKFSLRKGSYTIRCTDPGGKYCDVNVTITSIPIGQIAVIGLIVLLAAIAAAVIFGIRQALKTPFYGEVYMRSSFDGEWVKRMKARGRIPLNAFNLPINGIDTKKSYIQANRGDGVELVTDKEVTVNGRKGKKNHIPSGGTGTRVVIGGEGGNEFFIRFDSKAVSRGRSGGTKKGFGGGTSRMSAAGQTGRRTAGSGTKRRTTGRSSGGSSMGSTRQTERNTRHSSSGRGRSGGSSRGRSSGNTSRGTRSNRGTRH